MIRELDRLIPTKIFLTNGGGIHSEELASFEVARRDAGIAASNLVYVSSIVPPNCTLISRERGLTFLRPGQIVFCVMSHINTNEPNRLIAASIGMAVPEDRSLYGYLSEHESYGETQKKAGEYAEDLAVSMLASALGAKFDVDDAWDVKREIWRISGEEVRTRHICQSAEGDKDGLWTTAIAAAVMI